MKKYVKSLVFILCLAAGLSVCVGSGIPRVMTLSPEREVRIDSLPIVSFSKSEEGSVRRPASSPLNYKAKLFGICPIKEVSVGRSETRYVKVSGRPFGIKMLCDGVLVVGFSDILTSSGYRNPAKEAGLEIGDVITEISGKTVKTNEEVAGLVQKSRGKVKVKFKRGEEEKTAYLYPAKEINSGEKQSGMWVRDSGAGIGTMTFVDEEKGYFSGLGHGIKDADTHRELPLLSGEIVPVKITGIVKSKNGSAGQLKGAFLSVSGRGKVLSNTATGVYGKVYGFDSSGTVMPVADPAGIKTGKAYILTAINGSKPRLYEVRIEKVSLTASDPNKNLVIRVTDKRLLSLTGGIVRGMSGSPIIQDEKLVGAVTHVFVNRVDRGYGIFARNMLETLDRVYSENEG